MTRRRGGGGGVGRARDREGRRAQGRRSLVWLVTVHPKGSCRRVKFGEFYCIEEAEVPDLANHQNASQCHQKREEGFLKGGGGVAGANTHRQMSNETERGRDWYGQVDSFPLNVHHSAHQLLQQLPSPNDESHLDSIIPIRAVEIWYRYLWVFI